MDDDRAAPGREEADVDSGGELTRLHPRIQVIWAVRAALTSVLVGAIGGAAHVVIGLPRWVAFAAATIALVAGIALATARYRRWGYEVRDDALYLERGVVTEVRTVVPLVRIQHVDSRRNPIERAVGLASTVVYTAGSRGADVRIPGLTRDGARELRERLERLAILSEDEDAV